MNSANVITLKEKGFGKLLIARKLLSRDQLTEALNEQTETQKGRVAEGQELMDELVQLGFEKSPVPQDIRQDQIDALKMQQFHVQGDYEALVPMLEKGLNDIGKTEETLQLFSAFTAAELKPELKADLSERLILYVARENTQKHEATK